MRVSITIDYIVERNRDGETEEHEQRVLFLIGERVAGLVGPSSGDERGPAQEPPWIRHSPRIDNA